MSKPVTHAELEVALDRFGTELRGDLRTEFATKQDLERFATKQDLERFATKQDLERFATKQDLERYVTTERFDRFVAKSEDTTRVLLTAIESNRQAIASLSRDLHADVAQFASSIVEQIRSYIATLDDKYRDLPDRVSRLEDAVFTRR